MKFLVIRKRRITTVFGALTVVLLLISMAFRLDVTSVMAGQSRPPISNVECNEKCVAITMNLDGYINIEKIKEIAGKRQITFFASEYYSTTYCNDIITLVNDGYKIGILDRSMRGLTKKQINDILAYRVESLSYVTKTNTELVRFESNLYDSTCIKAVYDVDLYPIQWACDSTAENFSNGDIILVESIEEMKNTINKAEKSGFSVVSVENLLSKLSS